MNVQKLKALRTEANLTQYDLAIEIGMKCQTYKSKEKSGKFYFDEIVKVVEVIRANNVQAKLIDLI